MSSIDLISTLGTERQIGATRRRLVQNFERLSSGRRINRASDDAAGLAIAERLSALSAGYSTAIRNAADGTSLTQVADGAMSEQGSALGRMRELALQSANGTLNASDRTALNAEFNALRDEVDRVATSTNFNGIDLLQGGGGTAMQVGVDGGAGDQINVPNVDTRAAALGLGGLDIGTQAGAQAALSQMDTSIDLVSQSRGQVGAVANRLEAAGSNLATQRENTMASLSRIRDLDVAHESSSLSSNQTLLRMGILTQRQGNNTRGMLLNLIG
jgi:flagellin